LPAGTAAAIRDSSDINGLIELRLPHRIFEAQLRICRRSGAGGNVLVTSGRLDRAFRSSGEAHWDRTDKAETMFLSKSNPEISTNCLFQKDNVSFSFLHAGDRSNGSERTFASNRSAGLCRAQSVVSLHAEIAKSGLVWSKRIRLRSLEQYEAKKETKDNFRRNKSSISRV
jgi:hypothetical protein